MEKLRSKNKGIVFYLSKASRVEPSWSSSHHHDDPLLVCFCFSLCLSTSFISLCAVYLPYLQSCSQNNTILHHLVSFLDSGWKWNKMVEREVLGQKRNKLVWFFRPSRSRSHHRHHYLVCSSQEKLAKSRSEMRCFTEEKKKKYVCFSPFHF